MRIAIFTLIALILFAGNAIAARSMCPEKVLGTENVEGVYLGTACGDFCYSTIRLKNGEELTFMCGEDEASKFFGEKGSRVKAFLELQQFWNEFGAMCSREYACKSGSVITSQGQVWSFGVCMDKAAGVTDAMLECIQRETVIQDKLLNTNFKATMSSLESEEDKAALKAAQLAWISWKDKMASIIRMLDGGGSLSVLSANSFILEETQRQAERLHR